MPRHPIVQRAIKELRTERERLDAALKALDGTGRRTRRVPQKGGKGRKSGA